MSNNSNEGEGRNEFTWRAKAVLKKVDEAHDVHAS